MELKPWIGSEPRREPPKLCGYQLFEQQRLNIVLASLVGIPPAIAWLFGFYALIIGLPSDGTFSFSFGVLELLVVVLVFVVTVIVHEGLHGLAVALQGHRPIFGAGPGYFYTSVYEPLTRNGYFTVIIAPAVVINGAAVILALAVPELAGWLLVASTFNTTGLGGDGMMAWQMHRYPPYAHIVDLADGYAVYLPIASVASLSGDDR